MVQGGENETRTNPTFRDASFGATAVSGGACIVFVNGVTEGGVRPRFGVDLPAVNPAGRRASSRVAVHVQRALYDEKGMG